jgi:thiol:disulfide interchange protein DsbD
MSAGRAFLVFALSIPAFASGTATPPPPAPPGADFSILPPTAVFRPTNGDGKPHQVELRLLTDKAWAAPGDTFRLGLWLEQDDRWHTYWKVNAEVGQPTVIQWGLPPGATSTPYAYPVPQRFDLEGIVSYGYDDQVMFFTEVTVPANAQVGSTVLTAEAEWLTCEVQCIPGKGKVELPFEVKAGPAPPTSFVPLFEHFAAQHPRDPQAVADKVQITGKLEPAAGVKPDAPWTATFEVLSPSGAAFAPHAPLGADPWPTLVPYFDKDVNFLESTTITPRPDGGLTLVLKGTSYGVENPTTMQVGGLFQLDVGGSPVRVEYTIPMPWDPSVVGSATAVAEVAPATLPEGAVATVDDATCASMKAGVGNTPASTQQDGGVLTTLLMLGMAFLGGLILNVMPCVLPVLTLKVYGLVEQKTDSPRDRIVEGLAYTAGIVVSFLALAGALIGLQAATGQSAGWGFMFQYPIYVGVLAAIVFGFGLSLLGVFEIPVIGGNTAGQAGYKEGVLGYFMTGVFATLLATPCTAPFLGTAMGFAFSQPPWLIAVFFAMAGLGLASPFLVIAFIPALYRLLPQPGAWMDTFKQVMGFTLIATTIWLVTVIAGQVSQSALLGYVSFLGVVGFAAWIFGHFGGLAETWLRQALALGAATAVTALGVWMFVDLPMFLGMVEVQGEVADVEDDGHGIPWKNFDETRMASVLGRYRAGQSDPMFAGKPIFIDFTADWCLTCKANEKTVIETQVVENAIRDGGVVALKGDWTRRDEFIGSWLNCYQTAGVPYYLVLPADPSRPAIPLGETIDTQEIVDAIARAKAM